MTRFLKNLVGEKTTLPARRADAVRWRPQLECLGDRTLMAAGITSNFFYDGAQIRLGIYVGGSEGSDYIAASYDASAGRVDVSVQPTGSGEIRQSFDVSYLTTYRAKLFLYGFGGNDTINQTTWLDTYVEGGQGNDTLYGGTGTDEIQGDGDNDYIWGREGYNTLRGDNVYTIGHDTLIGGSMSDNLSGGYGNDLLEGHGGVDVLYGNEGHDTLRGGEGNDILGGNDGSDWLYGDGGTDSLYGDSYNSWDYGWDYLDGGKDWANDYLYGGRGADTFIQNYTKYLRWSGYYAYTYYQQEDTLGDAYVPYYGDSPYISDVVLHQV